MKILAVRGNPRKTGVCQRLGDLFIEGAREAGADVWDVDLSSLDIAPCMGCFSCSAGDKGTCVLKDDMEGLRKKLSTADALLCISPVYFYSMSAQMKIFWDRCFPFIRGYDFDSAKERVVNETNFEVKNKKFVTISVASGRLKGSFEAMSHTYGVISDAMGFEYIADIRRGESPYFGILGERAVRVRKILEAYKEAGSQLASMGRISPQVISTAELQLTESDEVFAANSKIFWQLHRNKKIPQEISDCVRYDPRILLDEMCRNFIPSRAPEKASIKFVFTDKNISRAIVIDSRKCKVCDFHGVADLTVITDSKSWCDMMAERRDVLKMISQKRIILEGDKRLFAGMKRFFGIGMA